MFELFTLEFMQRALLAGVVLAPLLAVLGSFATLRKMSFFADGIAHASLLGVAVAIIAGMMPFTGALILGLILGVVIFVVERYLRIAGDAVIGMVFTTSLALGIILISLQPGYQPELISFLFGSILSVTWGNVVTIFAIALAVLSCVALFFREFTLLTLSRDIAWVSGVKTTRFDLLFYILLSVSAVLGVKLLGIILVSALLITPAITAKQVTKSFNTYITLAAIFATGAFIMGLFGSYYFDLPSGASIVVAATAIFAMVVVVRYTAGIFKN